MSGLFLEEAEVAILTGIKMGRGGVSRSQRQIAALRTMGIPFHVNAVGRPIVARSLFENPPRQQAPEPPRWEPNVLRSAPAVPSRWPKKLK